MPTICPEYQDDYVPLSARPVFVTSAELRFPYQERDYRDLATAGTRRGSNPTALLSTGSRTLRLTTSVDVSTIH